MTRAEWEARVLVDARERLTRPLYAASTFRERLASFEVALDLSAVIAGPAPKVDA